jgi:hypothetical protein
MPILDGPSAEKTIRTNLSASKEARLAVAYWGSGAIERLGIAAAVKHGADIEVVCDLMSGSCNPAVIRQLRNMLGAERVLTRADFHAKVWITDAGAVLGSSNASANGLGFEGDEIDGLIEANFAIDSSDTEEISTWKDWYRDQARKGAERITDTMLDEADERWRRRRKTRFAFEAPMFELQLKKYGIKATARLVNREYVVQKGSLARDRWTTQAKRNLAYANLYEELVRTGILQKEESGEHRFFTKNHPFKSLSAAASVVKGYCSTRDWKPLAGQKT